MGQSVIIDRGTAEPLLVDDGRRVAENIKLDDPLAQMVVRTIYLMPRQSIIFAKRWMRGSSPRMTIFELACWWGIVCYLRLP